MSDVEPPSTGDGALQTTTSTDTPAESLDNLGLQLQGANASDPGIEDQVRSYTSQYIEQNGGPSVLGTSSQDEEAVVQQIVENLGDTGKSFEQGIRDQVDGIIRGRTGDLPDPTQRNLDTRADPVMMFNGQYTHQSEVDFIRI